MPPSDLELSLYRTLCWFSLFELPLTTFDLWKWLLKPSRPYELFEVDRALEQSQWLSDKMTQQNGFYFLKTVFSQTLLLQHQRRFLDATLKFRKLRRASYLFQLISGVESVFGVNSLAWSNTTNNSDIDVFIVTSSKRIWSTRLLVVLPFLLFGHRPQRSDQIQMKHPFCFSFFCSVDALEFETLKWSDEDYYFAYWLKSMVPIFGRSDVLDEIQYANKWADRVLPNANTRVPHNQHRPKRVAPFPISWGFFEPIFRHLQRNRFPKALRDLANLDSRVVITDRMLKFHENDRRLEFMQKFQEVYAKSLG